MAITCPADFDVELLRQKVSATYELVVQEPEGDFHFHRGLEYACTLLHYDRDELESLPADSVARFAGVANPHRIGTIQPGQVVLDIGSGAGMDLLLAARRTGPGGRAIGVDMTEAMRKQAEASARQAGVAGIVEVRAGIAEELPVEDGSIDVVISNGVLNLATDKNLAFSEVLRVLKPGGLFFLGDVVVQRELSLDARSDVDLWAAWIAGALPEAELIEITASVGFQDGRIVERFDTFKGTSAENKLSSDLRVGGVNFHARK